jgi:hypothetical protein
MKKIFVSITLLPVTEVEAAVLQLNTEISKKFQIKNIDPDVKDYAHVALYNANFPEHNRKLIEEILEDISKTISQIDLIPERINTKSRFISVVFTKTEILSQLQDLLLDRLNTLREGIIQSKYIEKAEVYSKEELENAHLYGYPFCKDQFSPHMTIAEVENVDDAVAVAKEIAWSEHVLVDKLSLKVLFTNEEKERVNDIKYFNFS